MKYSGDYVHEGTRRREVYPESDGINDKEVLARKAEKGSMLQLCTATESNLKDRACS